MMAGISKKNAKTGPKRVPFLFSEMRAFLSIYYSSEEKEKYGTDSAAPYRMLSRASSLAPPDTTPGPWFGYTADTQTRRCRILGLGGDGVGSY